MADGLISQIAQGSDPFGGFLRTQQGQQNQQRLNILGQQEQRLGQAQDINIEAAKQKAIADQRTSQLEGVKAQQDVLIKMGRTEDAMRLMPDVFKLMGADVPFDVEKLIEADRTKKLNFSDLLNKTTGILQDPKSSPETKQIAGKTLMGIISEAGKPAGQIDAQPDVQAPPQAQTTPQDRIRAARSNLANIQQQFPTISQSASGQAAIKTLEDSIKFEESQLPKTSIGNREETKIEFATKVAQAKLNKKLAKEGKPSRVIGDDEVGAEYEDIYGESVDESLLKAGGKSEITLQQKEFEDFQAQVGDSDREIKKNIKSNFVIDAGLEQLQRGIISGSFAKAELGFKKALAKAGLVNPETQEKITTTEAYAGLMGIRVGQVISLFGAGTGLSDADREFATKIAAGEITLDETSLNRLQKLNKQVLIEEAIIHNDLIGEFNLVRDDRGLKPSIRKPVDINKFLPSGKGKTLDRDSANLFKAAAKGNRAKAEELATNKGWKF